MGWKHIGEIYRYGWVIFEGVRGCGDFTEIFSWYVFRGKERGLSSMHS